MRPSIRTALAVLALASLGCGERGREESAVRADWSAEDDTVLTARVEEGTGREADAERRDYLEDVRIRIGGLDRVIDSLEAAARAGDLRRQTATRIRDARQEVASLLEQVELAGEEEWVDARRALTKAVDTLETRIIDAKRNTGPMGGRGPGKS